jgi:hypothetical protein
MIVRGRFVILRSGQLEIYDDYHAIPDSFDNVIEFMPEFPPGPHTDEEHTEIDTYTVHLQELMRRETNASSDPDR